jgi:SAM-dependent methyltransferase
MNELDRISQKIVDRYSTRFQSLGVDVKTLGWGSTVQQRARFYQALLSTNIDLTARSILDIGCGFGDLLSLMLDENLQIGSYRGWDINPDLIGAARAKFEDRATNEVVFEVVDVSGQNVESNICDVGYMLGLLNLNFHEDFDNLTYSKLMITNAFSAVNELLIVDFLSNRLTPDYPKEDFVFYHDPAKMLDFALTLTPNVVLKHNYAPIPQREFLLALYKN